jgi:hypothetical protein
MHQSYRSLTGKYQRHSERITCRRPLQFVVDVVFKCLRHKDNEFNIIFDEIVEVILYIYCMLVREI